MRKLWDNFDDHHEEVLHPRANVNAKAIDLQTNATRKIQILQTRLKICACLLKKRQ